MMFISSVHRNWDTYSWTTRTRKTNLTSSPSCSLQQIDVFLLISCVVTSRTCFVMIVDFVCTEGIGTFKDKNFLFYKS